MKVTLALYPNVLGLGYACVELPGKLLDFGVLRVRPKSNEKIMEHVKRFTDYFKPDVVILRDNCPAGARGKRIEELSDEIENYAKSVNLTVHRYTRDQVNDVFEIFGVVTKHEMATRLAEQFEGLEGILPKERKPWLPESYHMGIFDALALAVTHEYLAK